MAVAIAAAMAVFLAFLFSGFETPSDIKQSVHLALTATVLMLLFGGAEVAVSFLFEWKTPIGVKFMHFLGALSATSAAFLMMPMILDALEDTQEEKCETVSEFSIGPVTFSREDCDK